MTEESLEGELIETHVSVKDFENVEDLSNWLLLIRPQTFQVVTGDSPITGKKVHQIQWLNER